MLLMPMHFNFVYSGVIAQLSLPDQDKQSGEAQQAATPHMTMEVDWDLGVSGHSHDITEDDEVHASNCQQHLCSDATITSAATMINCSCNPADTANHIDCKAVMSADSVGLLSIDMVA